MRPLVLFALALVLVGCSLQREYDPTRAMDLTDPVARPAEGKARPQPDGGGQAAPARPGWGAPEPRPRLFPD